MQKTKKPLPPKPACFDSDAQWEDYQRHARLSGYIGPSGYCLDCTPCFKEQMLNAGRCSHPEVTFRAVFRRRQRNATEGDWELQGMRETDEERRLRLKQNFENNKAA